MKITEGKIKTGRKVMYKTNITQYLLPIFFVAMFCPAIMLGQDIKLKIEAPESTVVGMVIRVSYIIESDTVITESDATNFVFKNIEGFEILYGPAVSRSSSTSIVGGERSSSYSIRSTYNLKALKEGEYTLPAAEIKYNGKKYKADAVKVKVKTPTDKPEEVDAFIKTIVSKQRVNLSDTLTLTYRLYTTKEKGRIIHTDFPQPKGFYASNVTPYREEFPIEKINGKEYKIIDLQVLVLQPQKEGTFTIPEGEIVLEFATPTGKRVRDFWGNFINETIRSEKTIKIEETTIRVQDLKAV